MLKKLFYKSTDEQLCQWVQYCAIAKD